MLSRTRKLTANRGKWKSMDAPVIKTEAEPAALKLRSSGEHTFVPVKISANALYKKSDSKYRSFQIWQSLDTVEILHSRMKYENFHCISITESMMHTEKALPLYRLQLRTWFCSFSFFYFFFLSTSSMPINLLLFKHAG